MGRNDFDPAQTDLCSLETEFTQRLTRELREVSAGKKTLFFFSDEYNPHDLPAHWLFKETGELLQLARQSIALRELLVMPIDRCVGQLFIAACEENADLENHQRPGPKRLAARLLDEISRESN